MYKKMIKYTDYNGNAREEFFYFNLSKVEVAKWETETAGGMREMLENIIQTKDKQGLVALFDDIIRRAYGEKSADGKYFVKNKDVLERFVSTEAYSNLFMELASDDQAAAEFVNGIIPADLINEAEKAKESGVAIDGANITSLT